MATSWPCKFCGEECDSQFCCSQCFLSFFNDWEKRAEDKGAFWKIGDKPIHDHLQNSTQERR